MAKPFVYALDFDGVICDSAVETGITGWKAAAQVWRDMPGSAPEALVDQFRQVRPIIETGYEAILAMRLLYQGETVVDIYQHFADKTVLLMNDADITAEDLKQLFGTTRDRWIAEDLDNWIAMNPLYQGVVEALTKLNQTAQNQSWYIVTTKQERFVKQILQANSIDVEENRVFGLDRNMNKVAVLTELLRRHVGQTVYFLEDRLPTLMNVAKTAHLGGVKLVFASWGYNTAEDKVLAHEHHFTVQKLENFLE